MQDNTIKETKLNKIHPKGSPPPGALTTIRDTSHSKDKSQVRPVFPFYSHSWARRDEACSYIKCNRPQDWRGNDYGRPRNW